MISAHLASIPSRENLLKLVLESVIPYVDHVFVSLNGYKSVPSWLSDMTTVTYTMRTNERGDANKLASINEVSGLAYILDDDLVYTPLFFTLLQQKVNQYNCPVSLHGKIYHRPVVRFKSIKENYRCLATVVGDHLNIDVIGTGVLCFDTSMVRVSMDAFKLPNMSDIWFSKLCKEQGVPMAVSAHRAGIVKYLNPPTTIWTNTKDYSPHDAILKEFLK